VQGLFAVAAKLQRASHGAIALSLRKSHAISPLNNLARVQQALGRPAEAGANYRRALELAPLEPRLFAYLGDALGEQGNPCRPNHCKVSPLSPSTSSTLVVKIIKDAVDQARRAEGKAGEVLRRQSDAPDD
jgi:tetratricopeptide (TPR) repeat protein